MYVLVAVLTLGAEQMAFIDSNLYSSYDACYEEAQFLHTFYTATRPVPEAGVVVWCTQKLKEA